MSTRSRRYWFWAQLGALPLIAIACAVFVWIGNRQSVVVLPILLAACVIPVAYLGWIWASYHKSRIREIAETLGEMGFRVEVEPGAALRDRFIQDLMCGMEEPSASIMECAQNCSWLAQGEFAGTRVVLFECWKDARSGRVYYKSWHLFAWAPDLGAAADPDSLPGESTRMHNRRVDWFALPERLGLEVWNGVLRPSQLESVMGYLVRESKRLTTRSA